MIKNLLNQTEIRYDWTYNEVKSLFDLSFFDLLYYAQSVHRKYSDPNTIQISTLLSVKTGGCSEDCAYCPQSAHYLTGIKKEALLDLDTVIAAAKDARAIKATRFCVSTEGRCPSDEDFPKILEMIRAIKTLGLSTCATLGMLSDSQVKQLELAGLDYYNHNLDTSPRYYKRIITTRTYQDRLDTLSRLRCSSIKVCCGGIMGMGETLDDRIEFLMQLANLPEHPDVVPINLLIRIKRTPLENVPNIDPFDFIRVIAVARIMLPKSLIALAAGRNEMSDEMQALCFLAGAGAMHCGKKLLVTPLRDSDKDQAMLNRLKARISGNNNVVR